MHRPRCGPHGSGKHVYIHSFTANQHLEGSRMLVNRVRKCAQVPFPVHTLSIASLPCDSLSQGILDKQWVGNRPAATQRENNPATSVDRGLWPVQSEAIATHGTYGQLNPPGLGGWEAKTRQQSSRHVRAIRKPWRRQSTNPVVLVTTQSTTKSTWVAHRPYPPQPDKIESTKRAARSTKVLRAQRLHATMI